MHMSRRHQVPIRLLSLVVAFMSASASAGDAGATHTLTAELRSEKQSLPPGASAWQFRMVWIPIGCEYLRHDVELVEEFPELPMGAHRYITDWVENKKAYLPPGYSTVLSVGVGAQRPNGISAGRALIAVKLSITVSCEPQAFEKLLEQFGSKRASN